MKKVILVTFASATVLLTGCSVIGATPERMEAGRSGCDPRSPSVVPFTREFNFCKENFPKLADDYKAKEDRKAAGDCNVSKGDAFKEDGNCHF